MIEKAHRLIQEKAEELSRDSLKHGSLGMDSHLKYVHTMGRHAGLQAALEVIEDLLGGTGDVDERSN